MIGSPAGLGFFQFLPSAFVRSTPWWTWEWRPREPAGRDRDHSSGVISFMVYHLPPQDNGSTK
jgi:hypothetical protein